MKARTSGNQRDGTACQSIQYSDQMQCGRCGYTYDVNDPDPPECVTDEELSDKKAIHARKAVRDLFQER